MKNTISILLLLLTLFIITSCETGEDTDYDEKPVMFCYAAADSSLDSLFLSRTGGVNEPIEFEELNISGADISLYELSSGNTEYTKIGDLQEYPERPGVYYLPESDFPGGFQPGNMYKIDAVTDNYDDISAETLCPDGLDRIKVTNIESGADLTPSAIDPSVDTLYYRRGLNYDDIKLLTCSFDSSGVLNENRAAGFRLVPDEICKIDTSFWLEDTTKTVWEDYDITLQIFKNKKKYGSNFTNYFLRNIDIYWHNLYHEGMHTLLILSTDEAYRMYLETKFSHEEEIYTNVENGHGLFTISNYSAEESRYRIYVKSLENKYP